MPPFLRKGGEAGEDGVHQNGRNQRLGAAEIVRRQTEADTADGPPDQENGKDQTAIPPDQFGGHVAVRRPNME